jgi:hypothetical protein
MTGAKATGAPKETPHDHPRWALAASLAAARPFLEAGRAAFIGIATMSDDPMVRIYVNVPISKYNEIQADAASMEISMAEYVRQAIVQKLGTARPSSQRSR